jgi:hypothetical protein
MGVIILTQPTPAQKHGGNMAKALPQEPATAAAEFLELMRECGLELKDPAHVSDMMHALVKESGRHGAYDYVFGVRMAQPESVQIEENLVISLYRDSLRRFVVIQTTEDGPVRRHLLRQEIYIHGMQFGIGEERTTNWARIIGWSAFAIAAISGVISYVLPFLSKLLGSE